MNSVFESSSLRFAESVDHRFAVLVLDHALVGQIWILEQGSDGVEPEAANAALQPEADDVLECLMHLGVVPVQVRLLNIELVVVVLACLLVPLPRRVAKVPTASYSAAAPLSVAVSPLPSRHTYQSR